MMENKKCEECGQDFTYEMKPGFPRKYCPNCSAIKKASYNAKQGATAPQANQPVPQPVPQNFMSVKDISIVSQCMMKCVYYNRSPENLDEVYDTYHYFVKKLEENG